MKYLIGLSWSILTCLIVRILSDCILRFTISEFLVGWFSCMGYYTAKELYELLTKKINDENTKKTKERA